MHAIVEGGLEEKLVSDSPSSSEATVGLGPGSKVRCNTASADEGYVHVLLSPGRQASP